MNCSTFCFASRIDDVWSGDCLLANGKVLPKAMYAESLICGPILGRVILKNLQVVPLNAAGKETLLRLAALGVVGLVGLVGLPHKLKVLRILAPNLRGSLAGSFHAHPMKLRVSALINAGSFRQCELQRVRSAFHASDLRCDRNRYSVSTRALLNV
ncbi:MAG: hypothetical protein WDZ59_01385, partial [Pirellulales bacterium]